MNRTASHVAVFLAGAIGAATLFAINDQRTTREASFGSLAHHTRVALQASRGSGCGSGMVAESLNHDLRVIFMRYETITADEKVLLRLIAKHVESGDLVVEPAVAQSLRLAVRDA